MILKLDIITHSDAEQTNGMCNIKFVQLLITLKHMVWFIKSEVQNNELHLQLQKNTKNLDKHGNDHWTHVIMWYIGLLYI